MYELLLANKVNGKIWNLAGSVSSVSYETHRMGQPAKLTFSVIKSGDLDYHEGDIVRFTDGPLQFYGYVFTKVKDRYGIIETTCYDRARYLKANASYAFFDQTASSILEQIAADLQIPLGAVVDTGFAIPSLVEANKACIDIIQDALNQTLLNTGKMYVMYDDGAGLALRSVEDWKSGYILGDQSYVMDYSYKTDIDADTYNSVKLVQPNESTGRNDVVIVQDDYNIGRWGLLQLYKSVNGAYNTAQMTEQAAQTLSFYNRKHRTLSFTALGLSELRAGMMLRMKIDGLGDMDLDQYVLLDSVTHSWDGDAHTMTIETLELK